MTNQEGIPPAMTQELDTMTDDGRIDLLPPVQAPSASARAMLMEHAQMMQTAAHLAKAMVRTTMVPKRFFGKEGDAAAAILYGAELGLNPIQSLQRVVPIHGMPTLESRTMVGLLKARGYKVRTVEQSDTSVTVEGVALDGETASSTWTIDRAIKAGYVPTPTEGSQRRPDVEDDWVTVIKYWDNKPKKSIVGNMKYVTDPQTMLKAKAQAEVCRELAPEVLMGISYTREELESENQSQFDRADERGAAIVRVAPVTMDEIFAEEVPVPDSPTSESDIHAKHIHANVTPPDAPVGVEDEDAAPDAEPSANPTPAAPEPTAENIPENIPAEAPPAKKAPAKKAAAKPPRDVSKYRVPLEKRLFALLGDAKITKDDHDREDRIAIYRSIIGRTDVTSTNDLADDEVALVGDQLYKWQQANILDEQLAGILDDAAVAAETAAAAESTTTEGN